MFCTSTLLLKYICMSSHKGLWRTNLNCMRWSRRECELWLDEQEYLMWLITKIQKIYFSIQKINNKIWSSYTETKIRIQFEQTVNLCTSSRTTVLLTLILLTWSIGWVPNNASRWQMGFNSAFKGLRRRWWGWDVVKMLADMNIWGSGSRNVFVYLVSQCL